MNRKPSWLKIKVNQNANTAVVEELLKRRTLSSVCNEAECPNKSECYGNKTVTFIVMGKICTRSCSFCSVTKGKTLPLDSREPFNISEAVKELKLDYVVITSVTRDDLEDGGAAHFAEIINNIKLKSPKTIIEVLIPDFKGNKDALKLIVNSGPNVINHNIETVPSLYSTVRPQAEYKQSLGLLKQVKELNSSIVTKSGIMLGLGEDPREITKVLKDLLDADCQLLTIGQYLAPSKNHHRVVEYIKPEVFKEYEELGLKLGFVGVASSPLVRSSYNAKKMFNSIYK